MEDQALWKLSNEAWSAIESRYEPAIQTIVEQSGLEGRGWGLLLATLTFEPDPATPAHLMIRNPYTSADLFLARLRLCAGKGYLKESTVGEFRLTPKGRSIVEQFVSNAREAMAEQDPLLPEESKELAGYYQQLVDACLQAPPPPQSWSITLSYKLMPPEEPPLPYIEQAMSCLNAYRDDAHLAAWQGTGLTATSLEMLTLLWRKEAGSLKEIIQKLAYRGYSDQTYERALDELVDSGYIERARGSITFSAEGIAFRDRIEQNTNRYFFSPWACLSKQDKDKMGQYLMKVIDRLKVTAVNNS